MTAGRAWAVLRWVWFPVLLMGAWAWRVTPQAWVIIGFLGLLWTGRLGLVVAREIRWFRSFGSHRDGSSSVALRVAWHRIPGRLGLLVDDSVDGPCLARVVPAPGGWRAEVETERHGRELAAFREHAGALARLVGVRELRVIDAGPGRLVLRGMRLDPLLGSRPAAGLDRPSLVLGRSEDGGNAILDLLMVAGHLALQGRTRSGKSYTAYLLLAWLAGRLDVQVWGIDPTSVLLRPWEGSPGQRANGLGDLDRVLEVVREAVAVMDTRLAELWAARVDKFVPSVDMPALVVVLEEWPGTLKAVKDGDGALKPADRREPRLRAAVSRLIAEGAKVGVRVVMVSQRFDAAVIGGAERSNLAWRITHCVDNGDGVRMLHEGAPAELVDQVVGAPGRPGFAPGEALFEGPGQPRIKVKVDELDYAGYLARVAEGARSWAA